MRTYYRDDQVLVTSTAIWIEEREYQFVDLDRVWCSGGPVALRAVGIGVGAALAAVLFRVCFSYAWWLGGLGRLCRSLVSRGFVAIALLAVGVLAVALLSVFAFEAALLGIEHVRSHGRHRELWASVAGTTVLLLRTNDAARFEQIRRALARALGDRRS